MVGANKDDPELRPEVKGDGSDRERRGGRPGDNSGAGDGGGGVIWTLLLGLGRDALLEGDRDSVGLVLMLVSGLLSIEVNLTAETLFPSLPYTFLATLSANGISSSSLSLEI